MAAEELLRLADVHAYYGESHILHGVDLTVRRGEVVTLLGRNGAGRTTTLRAILGLTGKRSGSIRSAVSRRSRCRRIRSRASVWATARRSAASSPA
jgi:ABC-type branched-subunit amino acid transport system ATPase component